MKTNLLLFVLLLLFGCKKDKLKGDKEFLIGRWHWVSAVKDFSQPTVISTNPNIDGNNYVLEFVKCGKLKYFKNNDKVFTKRIKFLSVGDGCFGEFCGFNMTLNNDAEVRLLVKNISKDTIFLTKYPFDTYLDVNSSPTNYYNVYVRE